MSEFWRNAIETIGYKEAIFLGFYCSLFFILSIFGLHRFYNTYLFYKTKNRIPKPKGKFESLPHVTIQLPLFNEMYVVERLIKAVAAIEYPRDLLEIQVLDDSTDNSLGVTIKAVEAAKAQGHNIVHIHRKNRHGFKAGALQHGLQTAKGEFVAIFDSDFVPNPDFLMKTIHFFSDTKVGMVQARWEHLNRTYSILTEVQALLLDGHFLFEHGARNRSGRFFNFNGTAGIWRKTCIEDAGGWQHDTLTEDLDLSYRAQLKGWNFVFVPYLTAPAELPVEMNSFKTQQHRWAKGSIQTAFKLLPAIIKSKQPLKVKIEAGFHLLSNFAYLLILLLSFLLPLSIFVISIGDWEVAKALNVIVFILATFSVGCFYVFSNFEATGKWLKSVLYMPILFSVGLGLCVNNASAVLEAILGKHSDFERTPKYNIFDESDASWAKKNYKGSINKLTFLELLLGIYFTGAIVLAIYRGFYSPLPFLVLFQAGFLYVAFQSLFQTTFIKIMHRASDS